MMCLCRADWVPRQAPFGGPTAAPVPCARPCAPPFSAHLGRGRERAGPDGRGAHRRDARRALVPR
eukprot:6210821-Pleurochrysis_carterae.AAC.3